jgi:hypothetical protein
MFILEKKVKKSEDQSLNISDENDFKELIDEIDKIRDEQLPGKNSDEKSKIIISDNKKEKRNDKSEKCEYKINGKYKQQNPQINKDNLNNLFSMMNSNNKLNNNIKNQFINNQINNNIINNNINNINNFKTNINNAYYYIDNNMRNNNELNLNNINNLNFNKLISLNNNYKSNNNTYQFNNNLNVNNNCFNSNNNINYNLLISIIKNQILNDLKKKQIQENVLKTNNISLYYNLVNNIFPLNNENNINENNNNINFLLQKEINNQILNIPKKNNDEICENLYIINNNSQNSNCFNFSNININNQIQFNPTSLNSLYNNSINSNFDSQNNYNQSKAKSKKSNNQNKKKNNNKIILDPSKNQVNLMNILLCQDNRTTLMIKNIPNKYTISSFLEEINIYFKNTYDVFYLPIDYVNKCNLGFAFINFVEPLHILLFYELYRGKKWKKFKSDKICELLYAKYNNKKELIEHFEKGKVLLFDSQEKRPLILPTPKILPKINIPLSYLNIFIKLYPNVSYEIKECKYNEICKDKNNNDNNKANNGNSNSNLLLIFSINGNFKMNAK